MKKNRENNRISSGIVRMRFYCFVFLAVVICSVSVFAMPVPEAESYEGSDALMVGVFDTASLASDARSLMLDWVNSDWQDILVYDPSGQWLFIYVPDGSTAGLEYTGSTLQVRSISGVLRFVAFRRSSPSDELIPFVSMGTISSGAAVPFTCLVTSSYLDNYYGADDYPMLNGDYMAEYPGGLNLIDNSDIFAGGGGGEDPDEGGILDFLLNFWDRLRDFFVSLIVPSASYFDDWYAAVNSAAQGKLGGLTALHDILSGFGDMTEDNTINDTLIWSIPANRMFAGSPAVSVDVLQSARPYFPYIRGWLTAIIVILTAVTCYRRVIVLFEQ